MRYAVGIDVGGTNIKALAVTPQGKRLAEMALATEADRSRRWMSRVRQVLTSLEEKVGAPASSIGIAAPGLPAREGDRIAYIPARLPGLEGLVWRDFLRARIPVPVLNDAQAALMGEAWKGAAAGSQNVMLLTIGTGVGGAAMVDGHVLSGHIGRAGHLGHISLDPDGLPDIAQTPGSLEDAIGDATLKARCGGRFNSTRELVAAVNAGDREARAVWLKSVKALAAGLASLINVLDPEIVVLGGGIVLAGSALFRPAARELARFEWRPGGSKVRLVRARLGDRAGAYGAAWNALSKSCELSSKR